MSAARCVECGHPADIHTTGHGVAGRCGDGSRCDCRSFVIDHAAGDFASRTDALRRFTECGPAYVRRTHDALVSAIHLARLNGADDTGALGFLVEAEIAAGLRPADDWPTRYDPETARRAPAVEVAT